MLLTLIKNELIKIFKRGKTWIVFGLFLLLTLGMVFVLKSQADTMEFYNSTEGQIESYESSIKEEKEGLKTAEKNGDTEAIESAKENISQYERQLSNLKKIDENKDDPNAWKELLKEERNELQKTLDDTSVPELDKQYEKNRIEEINVYLDKDIKPIEEWEFNGINFIIQYMSIIGMIILACGIAVFMSDIVSGECTPPTLKFLLVQPISRSKVLLSKFISVILTVVALISGLQLIVLGVLSAFTGLDAAKMPIVIGTQYQWDNSTIATQGTPTLIEVVGSGHMTTRGSFLAQGFALQVLFIICCCAFIFMISCIFKSSMVTMAISVVVSVATTMVPMMSTKIGKIAHLLFFSYGDPTKVLDGSISKMYQNANFSIVTAIIVMSVTIVVSYLIGHIVFNKKDILI